MSKVALADDSLFHIVHFEFLNRHEAVGARALGDEVSIGALSFVE